MDGWPRQVHPVNQAFLVHKPFVCMEVHIVYGASVCGNIRKNKKSSIHVQSISKERINKESACAPPKAAPIQAQSRRILERKKIYD